VSFVSPYSARLRSGMMGSISCCKISDESVARPGITAMLPSTRTMGTLFDLRCRSDAFMSSMWWKSSSMLFTGAPSADTGRAGAGAATGFAVATGAGAGAGAGDAGIPIETAFVMNPDEDGARETLAGLATGAAPIEIDAPDAEGAVDGAPGWMRTERPPTPSSTSSATGPSGLW
jgi:hypothetical protein